MRDFGLVLMEHLVIQRPKSTLKHFRARARSGNHQIIGSPPNMLTLDIVTLINSGLRAKVRKSLRAASVSIAIIPSLLFVLVE